MKVKLSQAFDLQMGKTPSRNIAEYWGGDHKWVSIADIGNAGKYISETKECITDDGVSGNGIKVVPKGTVIMSFKLSIGKTAITSEDMYTNEAIMAFIDKGIYPVDPNYLYHLCYGTDWTAGTNKAVMGLTLNKATLSEKMINLPSVEEQKDIAEKLDEVDSLINIQQRQLAKLDELVKSRFVEMFGDVLAVNNLPVVQLSELAEIGSSKRIYADEYVDEGVPFYRSKEIRELGTGLKPSVELFITQDRYNEIKKKYGVPKVGDILIAAIGATIGYSWIVDTDKPFYYKDGNLIILSIKDNVNPIYLNHLMSILIDDFKKKGAAGSAQLALTIEKLEKIQVVNPDIDLQNKFAAFVEQTDKSKLTIQQSLDKLELMKKALMQKYFG